MIMIGGSLCIITFSQNEELNRRYILRTVHDEAIAKSVDVRFFIRVFGRPLKTQCIVNISINFEFPR